MRSCLAVPVDSVNLPMVSPGIIPRAQRLLRRCTCTEIRAINPVVWIDQRLCRDGARDTELAFAVKRNQRPCHAAALRC
jgi:hypothetical protein